MSAVERERPVSELIAAGYGAMAGGDWAESRRCFEAALAQGELPEAREGLGLAAYWMEDAPVVIASRERAYVLYRRRGDRLAAGRLAAMLGDAYLTFRGEGAVANGWLQRARRLLEGLEPSLEHGMLAGFEGFLALQIDHDLTAAREAGARALDLARTLGSADLEAAALSIQGLTLVNEGRVGEGMRLLDEATAMALSGEVQSPDMIMTACCFMIYACERVRDFDRSAVWCEKVKEFCLRFNYRSMLAYCRIHYAGVLLWRGQWAEAEAELLAATEELTATRVGMATDGFIRLGELYRRQGRVEEAARLFERVSGYPFATLGRAALAFDAGDAVAAGDLVERFLRQFSSDDLLERVDGLELALRARTALGRLDEAREALAQLQAAADAAAGAPPLRGAVAAASGQLAMATGDHDAARRHFEDAVDLFQQCGAPYETARARIGLAGALAALGRLEAAGAEARSALEAFRWVGAEPEVARAREVLERLGTAQRANGAATALPAGLTRREAEVLGLLARGLSNQEIAGELYLSVRTVERHISTIYAKIGADGPAARAIAGAFAFSHGLVPAVTQ